MKNVVLTLALAVSFSAFANSSGEYDFGIPAPKSNQNLKTCTTTRVGQAQVRGVLDLNGKVKTYQSCIYKMQSAELEILNAVTNQHDVTIEDLAVQGIEVGIVNGHDCDLSGLQGMRVINNYVVKLKTVCESLVNGERVHQETIKLVLDR